MVHSQGQTKEECCENRMIDQLRNVMPSGMQIPKEIKALYQYIEDNHLYIDKMAAGMVSCFQRMS